MTTEIRLVAVVVLMVAVAVLAASGAFAVEAQEGPRVIKSMDCSQEEVQKAIDLAKDGDTVQVPEGNGAWKKVKLPGKAITLQGAGIGKTMITAVGRGSTIAVKSAEGKPFRISGISFVFEPTIRTCVGVWGSCKNWRIDHCKFDNSRNSGCRVGVRVEDESDTVYTYGVIDHCIFGNSMIDVGSKQGHGSWKRPLALGTANAIYVEDCQFTAGAAIDGYHGGRYVFRHNKLINSHIATETLRTFSRVPFFCRAPRKVEIYNNQISSVDTGKRSRNWMMMFIRGGTGVIFANRVTNISGRRYSGVGVIDNARTLSPARWLGKCNGGNPIDGNEPAEDGTGSHSGADNRTVLTCAEKNWTVNAWSANKPDAVTTGSHSGADNQTVLTCAGRKWPRRWPGDYIYNLTDGSHGQITANTPGTVTAVLSGGKDNDWDNGDKFKIMTGCFVYNLTDGSKGQIAANTANTVTTVLIGGKNNVWNKGDRFKITNGYPALDQIGRSTDHGAGEDRLPQALEPLYAWDNMMDGKPKSITVHGNCGIHVKEGRDYFNNVPKPGYTPYSYPHPLTLIDVKKPEAGTGPKK